MTVVANGTGSSYYQIYGGNVSSIELGAQADTEDSASYKDRVIRGNPSYSKGFIGDNGIDSYRYRSTAQNDLPLRVVNDGNVSLRVYLDGELSETVPAGQGTNSSPTS